MVGLAPNEGCPDFTQLCQDLHLGLCLPPYPPPSHTRIEPGSEQSDPPGPVPEAEKGQEGNEAGCQSDFLGSVSLSSSPGKGLGENGEECVCIYGNKERSKKQSASGTHFR